MCKRISFSKPSNEDIFLYLLLGYKPCRTLFGDFVKTKPVLKTHLLMSDVKASWESTVFKEMEVSSCSTLYYYYYYYYGYYQSKRAFTKGNVDPMKEGEINTQKMFFKPKTIPKICAANISTEKPHVYRLWCNLNTLFDIRLLIRIYKLEEG